MQFDTEWLLTSARAAIHVSSATAVISDLHLGYGEARRRGGDAVPLPNVAAALAPLWSLCAQHPFRRLIVAGDLFEMSATIELANELLASLAELAVELTAIVPGNHDRNIDKLAERLPLFPDGFLLGGYHIVHGDAELPHGLVVQGHAHPWLRLSPRLSAPCYLIGADRLILPAFSTDAAGVNVLRQAEWQSFRCAVIVGDEVLDFGPVAHLPARIGRLN
jgi:metallophosphoesterase superfamily enzyme